MENCKVSMKIPRELHKYPLLLVIEFLNINEQILMLNMNNLIRTNILKYYECKVLKNYLFEQKNNFLQKFEIQKAEEIESQFIDNSKFIEFMNKIYQREGNFIEKDKIQLEGLLLLKYLNANKSIIFEIDDFLSYINLDYYNHISKLVNLSTFFNKPTGKNIVRERVMKIIHESLLLKLNNNDFKFVLILNNLSDEAFIIIGEVFAILPVTTIELSFGIISEDNLKIVFESLKINSHIQKINLVITDVLDIEISYSGGIDGGQLLSEILNSSSTIKKIKFRCGIPISVEGSKSLALVFANNKSLLSLNLPGNDSTNFIKYLADALKSNKLLSELNLSSCHITEEGLKWLTNGLDHNSSLLSLDLSINEINDEACKILKEFLETNKSLQKLNLLVCHITEQGLKWLIDGLKNNSSLLSLDLSGNEINNESCKHLGELMKTNKSLQKLDLYECNISEEKLKWLAEGLVHNSSLLSLDLSGNEINDEACKHLGELMKTNKSMQKLNLFRCNINSEGGKLLAEGLKNNSSLLSLDLSGNEINDEACKHLGELMKTDKSLQILTRQNLEFFEYLTLQDWNTIDDE